MIENIMNNIMEWSGFLTLLLLVPVLGSLAIMVIPSGNKDAPRVIALISALIGFFISVLIYFGKFYDPAIKGFQLIDRVEWLPSFGITYYLGIDGISLPMVLLTGILGVTAILASWKIEKKPKEYFALSLLVFAGVYGVFISLDLFFFLLFYELASIPLYFLIASWGSDGTNPWRPTKKEYAAIKLILYLQLGAAILFISFLLMAINAPKFGLSQVTFSLPDLMKLDFPLHYQRWLFPLLIIGFGIEAGLWPFHTWLPDGHSAAPTAMSMILAGVLLKMGGYGMIRMPFALFPQGVEEWVKIFAVIGIINIVYGAYCALKQMDIKYIVAYSSISHMGIVFLGLSTLNIIGFNGALFQMFSHGIITALLFALAGLIYEKTHTRLITEHGGLAQRMPFLATTFVIGALASLGLPTMSGFVAEFLVFLGTWHVPNQFYHILTVLAIGALVITATYLLRAAQKIFFGPLSEKHSKLADLDFMEKVHPAFLIAVIIIAGVIPSIITDFSTGTLTQILERLQIILQ